MSYSTKEQQAVLQCLEQCSEEPISAAALAEQLRLSGNPVGLATVYRQLEKLEQAGQIHKIRTEDCSAVSGAVMWSIWTAAIFTRSTNIWRRSIIFGLIPAAQS